MRILVDLDGVCADLEAGFASRWAEAGMPDLDQLVPPAADRTGDPRLISWLPADLQPSAHAIMDQPGLFAALPPIVGAVAGVQALRDAGHDVVICTAPRLTNRTCASDKHAWVAEHLGPEQAKAMAITKDKTLVTGDWLIDDWPDQTGRQEPTWQQVLFDQPYNRHVHTSLRLHGWADLPRLLPA